VYVDEARGQELPFSVYLSRRLAANFLFDRNYLASLDSDVPCARDSPEFRIPNQQVQL
jgi:hypothetical protein